jgi:hypothetical protein
MSKLIRSANTQYAGNFSNNLVSKIGCKGTSCNKIAAHGHYQSGGNGSVGDRGYSTSITNDIGVLGSPIKTYSKAPSDTVTIMKNVSMKRGGNNFPEVSPSVSRLTASVLSGGGRKTKKNRKGSRSKPIHRKKDFTTKKKSNRYNEKNFKKLFGTRPGKLPNFSFVRGRGAKGYSHPKKGQKSKTYKGRQHFTTKRGNKYLNMKGHAKRSMKKTPYMKGGSGGMTPLDFSKVSSGPIDPNFAKSNSKFYSIGRNAGNGGRLANPIPYKSDSLCPL